METQACLVKPEENGQVSFRGHDGTWKFPSLQFDVFSATQTMDLVQFSCANVLGIDKNLVNVTVTINYMSNTYHHKCIIKDSPSWRRLWRQDFQPQLRGRGLCSRLQLRPTSCQTCIGLANQHGDAGQESSLLVSIPSNGTLTHITCLKLFSGERD